MDTSRRFAMMFAAAILTAAAADPIRLHPKNPHYFEFRGKALALISSGEHYGSVINPAFDYRRYLETLSGAGLNYTRLFGGSYVEIPARSFGIRRNNLAPEPGRFIAPWARASAPGYEGGGNKFDLDQWNGEFFDRYRDFLSEAAKRGIIVEVTLFSSYYQEIHWKVSPFNPSNNVNQTEPVDWKKLHTPQNYANFGLPVRELATGASIVNFHYAYPVAMEANYGLGKAIGYDETGFLGRDDNTYCRQAWNFMLSGGSVFDNLDYSFSAGHEDGSDTEPNGPGGGSPSLRRQLGILNRFLNSMPLPDLTRDLHTVKHAAGVYARVLATPAGKYAMYFDGSGPAAITMDLPAAEYSGEWIDIGTGAAIPLNRFRHNGGEKVIETPEFRNGIALRLTRLTK